MPRPSPEIFAAAPALEVLPQVVDLAASTPLNPPIEIQQKFVGASLSPAYSDAERFVGKAIDSGWLPNARSVRILDFGAGWGRITRALLCRFGAHQIWAGDIDIEMTALINATLPGVNAFTNSPFPPLVFADGTFDVVTAFSVFSHLSEEAHRAWAREFGRVIREGGRVFITVLEEQFLGQVAGAQAALATGGASAFSANLAKVHTDPLGAVDILRQGAFVYAGGGEDDDGPRSRSFYAWAVAPRPWIETVWGAAGFTVEDWTPTGELFDQAMVTLVRRRWPPAGLSGLRIRARRQVAGAAERLRRDVVGAKRSP